MAIPATRGILTSLSSACKLVTHGTRVGRDIGTTEEKKKNMYIRGLQDNVRGSAQMMLIMYLPIVTSASTLLRIQMDAHH
jgi:hypothetical protein